MVFIPHPYYDRAVSTRVRRVYGVFNELSVDADAGV